jgi:hypothetical protein
LDHGAKTTVDACETKDGSLAVPTKKPRQLNHSKGESVLTNNGLSDLGAGAAAVALGLLFSTVPALGQAPQQASTPSAASVTSADIPRQPNGHPDFQGMWMKYNGNFAALTLGTLDGSLFAPGSPAAGGRGGGRGGRGGGGNPFGTQNVAGFIRPGVPVLPYLPEAAAKQKDRIEHHPYDDPEAHCHLPGVPRDTEQPPYPIQVIQDDRDMTILYEYVHDARIIPMNHGKHPKNYRAWDGDSRGYWDGDTFVVDVSNFNGETWLDMQGNWVDENEHVVERYKLVDKDTIAYSATVDDPTVFSMPWTMNLTLKRVPPQAREEENQILEYSCVEGERDTHHYTESVGGHQQDAPKEGPNVQK